MHDINFCTAYTMIQGSIIMVTLAMARFATKQFILVT